MRRLRILAKRKVSASEIAKMLNRHVGSVKRKARELSLILFKKGGN
jgi:IS30 family transposase